MDAIIKKLTRDDIQAVDFDGLNGQHLVEYGYYKITLVDRPEIYRKIITPPVFFRSVSCHKECKRDCQTYNRQRKPPCKRKYVKKFFVHFFSPFVFFIILLFFAFSARYFLIRSRVSARRFSFSSLFSLSYFVRQLHLQKYFTPRL